MTDRDEVWPKLTHPMETRNPLLWSGTGWRPRETVTYNAAAEGVLQAVRGFYKQLVCGETSLQDLGEEVLLGDDWVTRLTSFDQWLTRDAESIDTAHERRTYKMCLSYYGPSFDGWAHNTDLNSVESAIHTKRRSSIDASLEALYAALEDALGLGRVVVACAGRTDKGVSACAQVVSFHTWQRFSLQSLVRVVNQAVGDVLRLWWVERVDRSFHATFSAQWRRYVYLFPLNSPLPSPSVSAESAEERELDADWIETLLAALVGKKLDFYAFARDTPAGKSSECTLQRCRVFYATIGASSDCLCFELLADRFLRRMVRVLISTAIRESLPEGGRYGGRDREALMKLLETRNRLYTAPPAPPDGLCFAGVGYGTSEAPPRGRNG